MGNVPSVIRNVLGREQSSVETVALSPNSIYKWPPKIGNYFASYFIMGGQKFDTPQPEAYLFGDNNDLNFLGNRPLPFPYPLAAQQNEPTRTLQSLVNIRKDTLRLVKCEVPATDRCETPGTDSTAENDVPALEGNASQSRSAISKSSFNTGLSGSTQLYNLEFVFDSDAPCVITVMYFAKEEVGNGVVMYHPQHLSMTSQAYAYKSGANQTFSQPEHCIQPSKFDDSDWLYNPEKDEIPVVIHCAVDNNEPMLHAHITFASIEKAAEGYTIKAIKQKQLVDGLAYILQEFYGIENKESGDQAKDGEDLDDNTSECVICMSDVRDTLILPCRHLCLCNGCADSLRYQASSCPICRSPFHALLQIRAIRKKRPAAAGSTAVVATGAETAPSSDDEESGISQKGVPAGYEAVSLIEALNGTQGQRSTVGPEVATAAAKIVRRSSSAEASFRRSRGGRQKHPSGDSSTRRSKAKPSVSRLASASGNEERMPAVAINLHKDMLPAAVNDVEAGFAATGDEPAAGIANVQQVHELSAWDEGKKMAGAGVSVINCDSKKDCNGSTFETAVTALGRALVCDDDTDSGLPDDLTEDSRTTLDEQNPLVQKRVMSDNGFSGSAGSSGTGPMQGVLVASDQARPLADSYSIDCPGSSRLGSQAAVETCGGLAEVPKSTTSIRHSSASTGKSSVGEPKIAADACMNPSEYADGKAQ